MGTRNHPATANQAYAVTTVTKGRRPVFRDPVAADLMMAQVQRARQEFGFLLLSYSIMPDHVHLILVPGEAAGLARIMHAIKGRFARLWNKQAGEGGSVWQPRYYESGVRTEAQLRRRIEYVEWNPVRARLTASPEAYPYCSSGGRLSLDVDAYLAGLSGSRAEARPSGVSSSVTSARFR
jgi:putative transposase